ncbi:MAG: hypothetical protein P8J20_11330 [Novosphingobium sp.]|nr:hypothetical protein [Novosphingobium sp.]
MIVGFVASCVGPTDYLLVADFAVECPSLQTAEVRETLGTFAKRNGLTVDVQENSATYLRLAMEGNGFGHHIHTEYWAADDVPERSECSAKASPCIAVTAFAGGSIPEDEQTENTIRQEKVAKGLQLALVRACSG